MTVVRKMGGGSCAIRTLIGVCDVTDAQSWVAYVRIVSQPTHWLLARHNEFYTDASEWLAFGIESPGELVLYPGVSGGVIPPAERWVLVGGVHRGSAAGNKADFWVWDLAKGELVGSAENLTATPAQHSGTPSRMVFGQWNGTEQFQGLYAAAAVFDVALSKSGFELLASKPSVEGWMEATPVGLWVFDQASSSDEIKDLTGGGANGTGEMQLGFETETIAGGLPLPLRSGEEAGGGGGEGGTVLVRDGGVLVSGKRYVKQGGVLVPA